MAQSKTTRRKTSRSRNNKKTTKVLLQGNPLALARNKLYFVVFMIVVVLGGLIVYRSNANQFVAIAAAGLPENCVESTGSQTIEKDQTSLKRNFGVCEIEQNGRLRALVYRDQDNKDINHTQFINQALSKGFDQVESCVHVKAIGTTANAKFYPLGESGSSKTLSSIPVSDYKKYCSTQSIDGTNQNASLQVTSGTVRISTIGVSAGIKPTPPPSDDRPIIKADSSTKIDKANTIYDFEGRTAGEVIILASNVEVRNLKGGGARRIGDRSRNVTITDSGFRDFEFTFLNLRSDGGDLIRPYFINGKDVNSQPNVGDGDIIQLWSTSGEDIVEPLLDGITAYGKRKPSGSKAHNDTVQYTAIGGGKVISPTIRNSTLEGASSAAVQIKHVSGTFTFENNVLSERFESFHAVIGSDDAGLRPKLLWKNNTLKDGSSAVFQYGWSYASGSERDIPKVSVN